MIENMPRKGKRLESNTTVPFSLKKRHVRIIAL